MRLREGAAISDRQEAPLPRMRCPFCAFDDSKVIDSREAEDGIRRRRECLSCNRRFTTFERVQTAHLMVVKKDGRREEFSREKVRAGIRLSCQKLPVSESEIEEIVEEVEASLLSRGINEVPGTEVGDLVMDSLRELNYAAYVRFASHYKDFVSQEELQAEVARAQAAPRRMPRRAGANQPPLLPPTALDTPTAPPNPLESEHATTRRVARR
jgi:transcriptional repressor NrdR